MSESGTLTTTPANENTDPFLRADTALDELYRIRRAVLDRDPSDFTIEE